MRKSLLAVAFLTSLGMDRALCEAGSEGFFFQDGDRAVVLGDSITEPANSNAAFLEAYTLSRYPKWTISFRNLGWGGDTSVYSKRQQIADLKKIVSTPEAERQDLVRAAVEAALARDVFPLRPTAATINFGMNDGGWGTAKPGILEAYLACQTQSARQLQARGVRVAFITPRAVERGDKPGEIANNLSLAKFAAGLEPVAQATGSRYANAFQPLLELLVESHARNPKVSITGGDGVHPGPAGHLILGWAFLKALGAGAEVSSLTVDARNGKVIQAEGCLVDQLEAENGTVRFRKHDDALPLPIPERSLPALDVAPILRDLSLCLLRFTNLPSGQYVLQVDGENAGEFSAENLGEGVNLTALPGPIRRQGQELFAQITAKNQLFSKRWRQVQLAAGSSGSTTSPESPAPEKARQDELAGLDARIREAEEKMQELRQPKPHVFTIKRL